jgi:hypothetical protein
LDPADSMSSHVQIAFFPFSGVNRPRFGYKGIDGASFNGDIKAHGLGLTGAFTIVSPQLYERDCVPDRIHTTKG